LETVHILAVMVDIYLPMLPVVVVKVQVVMDQMVAVHQAAQAETAGEGVAVQTTTAILVAVVLLLMVISSVLEAVAVLVLIVLTAAAAAAAEILEQTLGPVRSLGVKSSRTQAVTPEVVATGVAVAAVLEIQPEQLNLGVAADQVLFVLFGVTQVLQEHSQAQTLVTSHDSLYKS
jgi:hypothetical protein